MAEALSAWLIICKTGLGVVHPHGVEQRKDLEMLGKEPRAGHHA